MPAAGSINGPLLRAAELVISVSLLTGRMCDARIHRRPAFHHRLILRVTSTGTGVVFAPESLLLVGLALLALHVAGAGGWRITRRR